MPGTTIVREAGAALITGAGPERSIPATKSFTTQVTILYLMALFLARKRGRMTSEVTRSYLKRLLQLPEAIEKNLSTWDGLAEKFGGVHFHAEKFLYLGRGVHYAIAREGALKLKEISYAHAEGYPVGELKHGPNALVDENLPVVVLATCDRNDPDSVLRYRRTLDVMKEVRSRRGQLVTVATEGDQEVATIADRVFYVPAAPELLLPILEEIGRAHVWTAVTDVSRMPSSACEKTDALLAASVSGFVDFTGSNFICSPSLHDALPILLRYRRTLDVMKEVRSRRGQLVTVATEGDQEVATIADRVFYVPAAPELLLPILE